MRGSRLIFNGVIFSSIELKSCICPPVRITPARPARFDTRVIVAQKEGKKGI